MYDDLVARDALQPLAPTRGWAVQLVDGRDHRSQRRYASWGGAAATFARLKDARRLLKVELRDDGWHEVDEIERKGV